MKQQTKYLYPVQRLMMERVKQYGYNYRVICTMPKNSGIFVYYITSKWHYHSITGEPLTRINKLKRMFLSNYQDTLNQF